MKKTAVVVGLILLACSVIGPAWAEEEEENKGKIRYDKGVKFDSADGKFRFKINNRVQVRYTQVNPDEGESIGSFRLRRFKFKMSGHVFTHWKYKLQLNFAGQGDDVADVENGQVVLEQDDVLEDAWFQYTKHNWIQPWVGQGKTKFSRERLNSSGKLLFVDRALISDEAEVPRDTGVALVGYDKKRRFEYNVGVYNGNALNQKTNDNGEFAYAGRAVWTPFGEYKLAEGALDYPDSPKLAVGIDGYRNTLTDETGTDLDIIIYGPEIAFKVKGFYAQAEYYRIDLDVAGGGAGEIDTGYLQASYLLPGRRIEFAGRISTTDPDSVAESVSNEEFDTSIGFNYYFKGHDFKVQADLTNVDDRSTSDNDSLDFRAQIQFAF